MDVQSFDVEYCQKYARTSSKSNNPGNADQD